MGHKNVWREREREERECVCVRERILCAQVDTASLYWSSFSSCFFCWRVCVGRTSGCAEWLNHFRAETRTRAPQLYHLRILPGLVCVCVCVCVCTRAYVTLRPSTQTRERWRNSDTTRSSILSFLPTVTTRSHTGPSWTPKSMETRLVSGWIRE